MTKTGRSPPPREGTHLGVPGKHGTLDLRLLVPGVLLDLCARLAAPGALLALTRSEANVALVSACMVTAFSAARALVFGRAHEASVKALWGALIEATRLRSVPSLRVRSDEHGSAALLDAVHIVAQARVSLATRTVVDGIAVVAVLAATVAMVGVAWLALGVVAVLVGGAVVLSAQRRVRLADRRGFQHYVRAAHDFEVLADGASELRAHGCEARHAELIHDEVVRMAREQRRASTYSALSGLFPLGIVLLVASAPFGLDLTAIVERLGGDRVDVGILGITGAFFGYGLAQSIASWARTAPHRDALATYFAGAPPGTHLGSHSVDPRRAVIELRRVTVRYPDALRATPDGVDFRWEPGVGVAVIGANGAGKSTLALCLLGLVEPTGGEIWFDDVPATELDWESLRKHVAYVPQEGYFATDRSIEWHLRLLSSAGHDELEAALRRVGLWAILDERATKRGGSPFEIPVSQLSGGERKRLQLARAILGEPALVVLDEPEAALDEASRRWLETFLEELAPSTRVLCIAHDPSVVPASFQRIVCRAAEARAERSGGPPAGVANAEMPAR